MIKLSKEMQTQFNKMQATGKLFRVNVPGQEVWDMYLNSFVNEGRFRDPESSEHNCNYCKNFIRRYGNIVAKVDGGLVSLFTNLNLIEINEEYHLSIEACDNLITNSKISNVFFEHVRELNECNYDSKVSASDKSFRLGNKRNHKRYTKAEAEMYKNPDNSFIVQPNQEITFNHFHLDVDEKFVLTGPKSIAEVQGDYRTKQEVFLRAITEISEETLDLLKEMINQGSLLDGTAHLPAVENMIKNRKVVMKLSTRESDLALNCWDITYAMHEGSAKFRNHMTGKFCIDIEGGMDLNKACEVWNKLIDPKNYKKAKAPITKKQIADAQKFVEERGYEGSFSERRIAKVGDISVEEIKHINQNEETTKRASLFDNVKSTAASRPNAKKMDFSKVQEVAIEEFMEQILPNCESVEAYFENKMEENLVAMTCADSSLKNIFKWDNPYSWTFKNNLAGKSYIKDAVKAEGGITDADFRFSLMWAEGDINGDNSDLDAHLYGPEGHIHFGQYALPNKTRSGGNLDLDITSPQRQRNWKNVAENITYPDIKRMLDGEYRIQAVNYHNKGTGNKYFDAELEICGEVYNYHNPVGLKNKERKDIAIIRIKAGQVDSIKHLMPEQNQSKELWGLETKQFHKVNLVCLSPNHWGDNNVGNKHYMFMLEGCKSDTNLRSFHVENLNDELTKHRKVLEVLGTSAMIEPNGDEQLSGLGFNATVKDELVVRCKGSINRMLKIKF